MVRPANRKVVISLTWVGSGNGLPLANIFNVTSPKPTYIIKMPISPNKAMKRLVLARSSETTTGLPSGPRNGLPSLSMPMSASSDSDHVEL